MFFYRRIFCVPGSRKRWFEIASIITIPVVLCWAVAFIGAGWLDCGSHLSAAWDGQYVKYCSGDYPQVITSVVTDLALDLWILILPIPCVRQPRIPHGLAELTPIADSSASDLDINQALNHGSVCSGFCVSAMTHCVVGNKHSLVNRGLGASIGRTYIYIDVMGRGVKWYSEHEDGGCMCKLHIVRQLLTLHRSKQQDLLLQRARSGHVFDCGQYSHLVAPS